jgi:hypothetical protein
MELRAIKSYYDNRTGLVTLDDDVLSIVSQVREQYGSRVKISWDPLSEHFVFSEMCDDQVERLIFTTLVLDGRALDRLMRSDSQRRGYEDPYDADERLQDKLRDALDDETREKTKEPLERLVHELKRGGMEPRLPLTVAPHQPRPKGVPRADR